MYQRILYFSSRNRRLVIETVNLNCLSESSAVTANPICHCELLQRVSLKYQKLLKPASTQYKVLYILATSQCKLLQPANPTCPSNRQPKPPAQTANSKLPTETANSKLPIRNCQLENANRNCQPKTVESRIPVTVVNCRSRSSIWWPLVNCHSDVGRTESAEINPEQSY